MTHLDASDLPRTRAMLVLYDHAEREFAAMEALYRALAADWEIGFRSEHFELLSASRWSLRHRPQILVLPQCYRPSDLERLLPVLVGSPRVQILVTHEEQLTMPIFRELLWPSRPDSVEVLKGCWHIVWNERSATILEAQGVDRSRIFVCGHLRSAVRSHERSAATRAQLAADWGLDPHKRWVLFAENRTNLLAMNEYERNGMLAAGVKKADLDGLIAEARAGVRELMADLARVSSGAPEILEQVELIYRPHPGKAVELGVPEWVHTISERDIHDWLASVDVYATHQSTSIFEASLYGIPCFRVGNSTPEYTIEGVADIPVVAGGIRAVVEFAATDVRAGARADIESVADVARSVFGDPKLVLDEYGRAIAAIRAAGPSQASIRSRGFSVWRALAMVPRRFAYEVVSYVMVRTGAIRRVRFPRSTASHLSQVPYAGSWEWPGS